MIRLFWAFEQPAKDAGILDGSTAILQRIGRHNEPQAPALLLRARSVFSS